MPAPCTKMSEQFWEKPCVFFFTSAWMLSVRSLYIFDHSCLNACINRFVRHFGRTSFENKTLACPYSICYEDSLVFAMRNCRWTGAVFEFRRTIRSVNGNAKFELNLFMAHEGTCLPMYSGFECQRTCRNTLIISQWIQIIDHFDFLWKMNHFCWNLIEFLQ
jgi:hypothetical protein